MATSKQKPVPEGSKRSPGKVKFSMPRKEAPPIDGSYLDRLFTDFINQSQELKGQGFTTDAADSPSVLQTESASAVVNQPSEVGNAQPVAPTIGHGEADLREPALPGLIPLPQIEPAEPPKVPQKLKVVPASHDVTGADSQLLDRWKKKHRLSKGELKVIRVMLDLCRQGDGDSCFVKIPYLMEAAELRERQTQLVLKSLRELGLIVKIADYSNVDRLGTQYRINLDSE